MIIWTEERVATLKLHWERGLSATESAKALGGVTRNGVVGKRFRLGLRDKMRSVHPAKSREGMKARNIVKSIGGKAKMPHRWVAQVSSRSRFPLRPDMSKAALRELLRCAVENTL